MPLSTPKDAAKSDGVAEPDFRRLLSILEFQQTFNGIETQSSTHLVTLWRDLEDSPRSNPQLKAKGLPTNPFAEYSPQKPNGFQIGEKPPSAGFACSGRGAAFVCDTFKKMDKKLSKGRNSSHIVAQWAQSGATIWQPLTPI